MTQTAHFCEKKKPNGSNQDPLQGRIKLYIVAINKPT